jgi:hypothetical protein
MPSVSKKQHNLMAMVANDPKAAKRLGIPQSVGRDYVKADKGRKFGDSNMMKKGVKKYQMGGMASRGLERAADMSGRAMPMRGDMADKMGRAMAGGMKKGGKVKKYRKGGSIDGCAMKGKTRGKMV